MSRKEGVLLSLCLPKKVKAEIERLDNGKWRLHYIETTDEDTPEQAHEVTMQLLRQTGINAKRRKNTLFYTIEGNEQQVFAGLLGELLVISKIGDLTIRELVVLAAYGVAFKGTEKAW